MIVPRLIASSIEKRVSPGTYEIRSIRFRRTQKIAHPTVFHRLLPALTVFADTNDDVQAVITRIEALSMTLRAIADHRKSVIFEVLLELRQRPVAPLVNGLLRSSEVESFDSSRTLDHSRFISERDGRYFSSFFLPNTHSETNLDRGRSLR